MAAALAPIGHGPLPLLPFVHLGIHRTWGQLPSGSSVFAFLPVEQISLEKEGKVALMEENSQDHPCKRWGQVAEQPKRKLSSRPSLQAPT